jgi:hypothetical protein
MAALWHHPGGITETGSLNTRKIIDDEYKES